MKSINWKSLPEHQSKAMKGAIAAQCFGMVAQQMISGGILLLYLNALNTPPSLILTVLNLFPFITAVLNVPLGFLADKVGIKRFGMTGNILMLFGLGLISGSAFLLSLSSKYMLFAILSGLIVHAIGTSFFNSGWFSLLSHFVPPELTGRYFGVLRFSWQFVTLLFFAISSLLFTPKTPIWVYQTVLAFGALVVGIRFLIYKELPAVPVGDRENLSLSESVYKAISIPGFLSYISYLFLIVWVSGNSQDILRLSAVKGHHLGDNEILFLTVSSMIGSLIGFKFMGIQIDRHGPHKIFLFCHGGYALALFLFPLGMWLNIQPLFAGSITSLLLGISSSTLGLCTTAQSFRICQGNQRTIAYALVSSIQSLGSSISGFLLAGALSTWGNMFPIENLFDFVLLGLGSFILLQLITHRLLSKKFARKQIIQPTEEKIPIASDFTLNQNLK